MHILILPSWCDTIDEPWRGAAVRDQAIALSRAGTKTGIVWVERRRLARAHPLSFLDSHGQIVLRDDDGVPDLRTKAWNLGVRHWLRQTRRLLDRYVFTFGMPDLIHALGDDGERAAGTTGLPYVTDAVQIVDTDYFTPSNRPRALRVVRERDLRKLPRWHVREWLRDASALLAASETSELALRAMAVGVPVFTDPQELKNAPPPDRDAIRAGAIRRFGYDAFAARMAPIYAKALGRNRTDVPIPVVNDADLPAQWRAKTWDAIQGRGARNQI